MHVAHTAVLRTDTESGETKLCVIWNCPIGQTHLQKLPPRKSPSISRIAAKYPTNINAVALGFDQRSKASYVINQIATSPTASHFDRNALGQRKRGFHQRRIKLRGAIKGQDMQRKLPPNKSAITTNPRQ